MSKLSVREAQNAFAMPNEGNLNFFQFWLKAINNAVITLEKFATLEISKLWNHPAKPRSFCKQTDAFKNFVAKFFRRIRFVFGNVLYDLT